jgi:hypothetical protein
MFTFSFIDCCWLTSYLIKHSGKKNTSCQYMYIIDWLFTVLRPAQEYFTYMETSPLPVKEKKNMPMLCAQGLWAGRYLYRATPTMTLDLGFSGLIWRTSPFSRLLRHAWGSVGPFQTRILTGQYMYKIPNIQYECKITCYKIYGLYTNMTKLWYCGFDSSDQKH